jgi:hypothetical protein
MATINIRREVIGLIGTFLSHFETKRQMDASEFKIPMQK